MPRAEARRQAAGLCPYNGRATCWASLAGAGGAGAMRRRCSLRFRQSHTIRPQRGPEQVSARFQSRPRTPGKRKSRSAVPPSAEEMYPAGAVTWVIAEGLSERLEGKSRPGHFRGVATIVSKLFHIVEPDRAYFGQKDAQQTVIIRKMVRDLGMGVEVVVCPTVRESDGLALSSRNVYLNPEERKQALVLYRALCRVQALADQGERDRASCATWRCRCLAARSRSGWITSISWIRSRSIRCWILRAARWW